MNTALLISEDIQEATESLLQKVREIIPTEIVRQFVSEWAEENRTLPPGLTPYPGPFSFDVMPYLEEIVDCLSETSDVHEVAVMKGTQIGFTVGTIENWIGYTIDSSPAPMLYVTGDAQMADTQMELRVDSMINHSGIGHKIGTQRKRDTQRKTGDIKTRKEFPGGFLVAAGPNSGPKLRSMSFQKINVDEVDAFRHSTGREGDPIELIRRRTDAFSEMYKILWGSTPLFEHDSKILELYHKGDQRKYFVPCKNKKCGKMQFLKWKQLKFEHNDDNRLIPGSVYYECEYCGSRWRNADKDWFLPRGEWRATAEPRIPGFRSYHIPGLYSPVGFRSWEQAVYQFLEIKNEGFIPHKFQNFINTFLGEPFVDVGERPKIEAIVTRDRGYSIGTIPKDVRPLFITIGADVQKDRIECEVVAWGRDKESWSINYHVIHGDTSDPQDACWEAMRSIVGYEYDFPTLIMPISVLSGIDAGYRTDVVYDFCDTFDAGVHPVMGNDNLNKSKEYIKVWSVSGRSRGRIDINTDLLKQEVYKLLSFSLHEDGTVPKGYCHFPREYTREHFSRLTAEHRVQDPVTKKTSWDAGSRRNEQLDCRVYALAMVYAYMYSIVEYEREARQDKNYTLSWPEFWDYIDPEGAE